jgi:hypothetical protein
MTGQELVNEVLLELNQDALGAALGLGDGDATDTYTIEASDAVLVWLNEAKNKLNRSIWPVEGVATWTGTVDEVVRWSEFTASGDHDDLWVATQVFWDGSPLSLTTQDNLPFYRERLGETGTPRYAAVLAEGVTVVPLPTTSKVLGIRGKAYGQDLTLGAEIPDVNEHIQRALKVWARVKASGKLLNEGFADYYKAAASEWKALTSLEV